MSELVAHIRMSVEPASIERGPREGHRFVLLSLGGKISETPPEPFNVFFVRGQKYYKFLYIHMLYIYMYIR